MIKILVSPSCQSCRKTIKFFKDNDIPFSTVNIIAGQVTLPILKDILSLTDNGSEDIISKRCSFLQRTKINVDNLLMMEMFSLVLKNPTILKRPIIYQANHVGTPKRLMVGYNSGDIEIFLRDKIIEKHFANLKKTEFCATNSENKDNTLKTITL